MTDWTDATDHLPAFGAEVEIHAMPAREVLRARRGHNGWTYWHSSFGEWLPLRGRVIRWRFIPPA